MVKRMLCLFPYLENLKRMHLFFPYHYQVQVASRMLEIILRGGVNQFYQINNLIFKTDCIRYFSLVN